MRHHSAACEASLDRYYNFDLRDWYRGKVTARWLWVRLFNLPMDSPLAYSITGETDDESVKQDAPPETLPWPPTALYSVPVAPSFAEVGKMLTGADLN